jgi:hypothetical protein
VQQDTFKHPYVPYLKAAYCVPDWGEFLQRSDRLSIALEALVPPCTDPQHFIDGGKPDWVNLICGLAGIGSEVWPEPTQGECEACDELYEIAWKWMEFYCYSATIDGSHESTVAKSKECLDRFENLKEKVKAQEGAL